VWKYTFRNNLTSLENIERRGRADLRIDCYHLDHKYSIFQGFLDGVPADVIGSKFNLEMLPWRENLIKRTKCSISLEELMNEANKANKAN